MAFHLCRRRKICLIDQRDAAGVIAGFFRCVRARRRVVTTAKQIYARVFDPDYQQHFYSNLRTGNSSWSKPLLLLSHEAPLMLMDGQHRRSPMVNREQLMVLTGTGDGNKKTSARYASSSYDDSWGVEELRK